MSRDQARTLSTKWVSSPRASSPRHLMPLSKTCPQRHREVSESHETVVSRSRCEPCKKTQRAAFMLKASSQCCFTLVVMRRTTSQPQLTAQQVTRQPDLAATAARAFLSAIGLHMANSVARVARLVSVPVFHRVAFSHVLDLSRCPSRACSYLCQNPLPCHFKTARCMGIAHPNRVQIAQLGQ